MLEVQTRSEGNGIAFFQTIAEAMAQANKDPSIWKISFPLESGERIRLVRSTHNQWILQPLEEEVNRMMRERKI